MSPKPSHWPLTILGSASSLLNLFLPIVLSRELPQSEVGDFKIFFLYLATLPALSLGVGFTNGCYLWGADPADGRRKCRSAFLQSFALSCAAALFVAALGSLWQWPAHHLFLAIACPPAVCGGILEAAFVAQGRVRAAALFSACFEASRLVILLQSARMGAGVEQLIALHAGLTWLKLAISWILLDCPLPGKEVLAGGSGLWRYAIPVSAAAIFDLMILNADRYVLSTMLSSVDFAVYSFGCLMVPPLFVFEQSVNQVLIPQLAKSPPRSGSAAILYHDACEQLLALLVPASAGLIALSSPLVRMLFTDAYSASAPFLAWYSLYYALSAIPQDVLARARADSRWIFRTAVAFGALAIAGSTLGARHFGPLGALQAFVAVQLLRRAYALRHFAVSEDAAFGRYFPWQSLLVILGASLSAGLAARQASLAVELPWHSVLAGFLAFVPVYFGLLLLWKPALAGKIFAPLRRA